MRSIKIPDAGFSNELDLSYNHTESLIKYYGAKLGVVRFFAICSIVWGHTILEWDIFSQKEYVISQSVLFQFGKIGTINFFIISGFLLNKRISEFNIGSYLRYRKFSLILPWFIFLSILVLIHTCRAYSHGLIFKGSFVNGIKEIAMFYRDFIVYNAYWFVPVSLISSCILILFKKFSNNFWFFLLIITCYFFYSANLYQGWISQSHTKSIFAYVIFMWIGMQISRNIIFISLIIDLIQWHVLVVFILIFFSLACFEGIHLSEFGSKDPYSSLRISNSLLSTILFITCLKLPEIKWIKVLKPNSYVFGVYLIQAIAINEIMPLFTNSLVNYDNNNLVLLVTIQCLIFAAIFLPTYLLSILIKNSKIRFIMGRM